MTSVSSQRFGALLLVALLTITACMPGAPSQPSGGSGAAAKPTRPELRLAVTQFGNESLDPIKALTDNERYLKLIFDPLVGSDRKGEQLSKDTGVAEDWTISGDGLVYTFKIRQGITFHNGDPLTAEDVKFSLDRYALPDAVTPNTARIRGLIDQITVKSPTEVEVRLKTPSLMFLNIISNLVDPGGLIVPKKYFESVGAAAFGEKPIGSGPYKFVERQTGSQITLEKAAARHFAIGEPRFDRVTLRLVAEESTRLAMLRAGDADFIDIGIDKVVDLEKEKFRIFKHNGLSPLYVVFQLREGDATQDINVRMALSQAINRDELSKTLLNGLGEPTGNVWPGVGQPIPPTTYDLEAAKASLAKTPYGPNNPLRLTMQVSPAAGWPQMLPLSQAVQDAWKKIGVEATLVNRDFGAVRTEWLAGGLPAPAAVFMNFDPQVDWQSVVSTVWTCTGLFKNICDQELDAVNGEWGKAASMDEYLARANAHEKMMHDKYYVLPLVTSRLHFAGNDQLPEGYQPGNIVRGINVRAMVWNP